MTEAMDLSGTTGPAVTPATDSGGRELTPAVAMLAVAVAIVSLLVGALMAAVSLAGHAFGAWKSPEALTPGLIGAAMLGVSPGLLVIGRARVWEEVRTLVLPLAVVLVGLLGVSLGNAGNLQLAEGGSVILVLFSLGWIVVLGVLAAAAVACVGWQYTKPALPLKERVTPLPGWSKPLLAVLGSSWLGIGAGLLARPRFWADFVPWTVNRSDAQALGVWALALGIGVLGALAEDDLHRLRPALLAVPGVALAAAVVLGVHASDVDWTSGPGLSLTCMITGLLLTGATGTRLLSAGPASPRGTIEVATVEESDRG
ncbi:hypothetical protein G3I60_18600 [Streptomyces sp. SID13666]|uniref:hypothetical protein n=1 Tax=unclassified Streptomyces TaxID=2593676 RepID=UPI0013C020D0|nr:MULTISPECIES: hypothetical protein [unclassified Streptomyces]NEA56106.1 hypothetical protein [Streptomyces sp. SID13666]NEA71777.1 hypothetical protein [Streptomyces sp. SID13588]